MSAWSDAAELIKTRLDSLMVLQGVDVIVDRQTDVDNRVAQTVGMGSGLCVVILWDGGRQLDEGNDASYTVRVYGRQILQPEDKCLRVDDALEAIVPALHEWHPSAHCFYEYRVADGPQLIPHRTMIVYELEVKRTIVLPEPEFIPEIDP